MTDLEADKSGLDPPVTTSRRYVVARKRTTALMRGLKLILAEHSASDEIIQSLNSQVHSYLDVYSDEGLWVEHAKSLLSHPFSQYLNNEPPKAPTFGIFHPQGRLKRWMKVRLNSFNAKNTHLWYSWLQAKRSCLPATEASIEAAYRKHSSILSKDDDGDDQVIARIMANVTFRQHLDAVRSGIQQYYLEKDTDEMDYRPSLRSSLSHTRAQGGALGCIRENMELFQHSGPMAFILESNQLGGMEFQRRMSSLNGKVSVTFMVIETRIYDESLDLDFRQAVNAPQVYRSVLAENLLSCRITGIIEPLKVRVISRGPAKEYYLCKKLQKAMHDTMRQMPAYRLIGRPLLGGDTHLLDHTRLPGNQWFSIDYSAATDNLSYKYSRQIFDYILNGLPTNVQSLAHKVLGLHNLIYPETSSVTSVTMARGQLMGSILSFPVLCLANMGVYLDVTNEYQRTWNYSDRTSSVLINGDDQLYSAPKLLWPDHAAVSNAVGLELSVGKAYVHPTYLNINSTSIHHRYGVSAKTIDYLNTGLFFGQSKVMKTLDCSIEDVKDTTVNLNRLLAGSLPGRQHIVLAKFLSHHGLENIDKENRRFYYRKSFTDQRQVFWRQGIKRRFTFIRDLFTPISLGGCGVMKPLRFKTRRWKKVQSRIASGLYNQMVYPSVNPLPGPSYNPSVESCIPNYGLESVDSRQREIFSYSTKRISVSTALEYSECANPIRPTLIAPLVLPPVRDYFI